MVVHLTATLGTITAIVTLGPYISLPPFMALVAVYLRFVGSGFKWPLRPGDHLELWSPDHQLVGQIDAGLLLDLLALHIRTATMVTELGQALSLDALRTDPPFHLAWPPLPEPPHPPAGAPLARHINRARRAALRTRRRARRKS